MLWTLHISTQWFDSSSKKAAIMNWMQGGTTADVLFKRNQLLTIMIYDIEATGQDVSLYQRTIG